MTPTICEDTTLDAAGMSGARGRELTGLLCGCDVTDALHGHHDEPDQHSCGEQQRASPNVIWRHLCRIVQGTMQEAMTRIGA